MSCLTGYEHVPFVRIDEIYDDAVRILSLIGVYNISQLFAIDPDWPPRRTQRTLIERANATFSRHFPLFYIQRVNIYRGQYTFRNNILDYINNNIQPRDITLVPDAVVSLTSTSIITAKYGLYKFAYQPPTLYMTSMPYMSGVLCAKTLCKYPLVFDDNNIANDAMYFMDRVTPLYDIFIKQVVLDIAEYIIALKNNYQLTNLPIEVFLGLENKVGDLKSELETLYNENPRNFLIFY